MMRIAQVSTLSTPVCREGSGSIEHLVWLLSEELTRLGHEVTVFAATGSDPRGELVATLPGGYGTGGAPGDWQVCEWINLGRAIEQAGRFDILHSHAYLWGLPLQSLSPAPIVHTLHVTPYDDQARLWSLFPNAPITAISNTQWQAFPHLTPFATIHHGLDPAQFSLREAPDDYLCFLGRFIPNKGPLDAIAIARASGIRLLMAGPRNEYYRESIAPHVDGRMVEYVGQVSGAEKDRLLGGARALLYPVRAPEPFGLVLVEAMLCGTPVLATGIGAVPEIVDQGITGFYCGRPDELCALMPSALRLDRTAIRQRAESRFSAERMAKEYADVYGKILERRSYAGHDTLRTDRRQPHAPLWRSMSARLRRAWGPVTSVAGAPTVDVA